MKSISFPDMIKNLPKANIPITGVEAWIAQGTTFQIVFFEIQSQVKIPAHKHAAQYGVLIEGSLSLTIGEETNKLLPGHSYYIPKDTIHSAETHTFCRVMDFFADPHRYSIQ